MAANLPKFGNWDTEEDVPYTAYFENPRRASAGEKANTNKPRDMISKQEAPKREVPRMKLEHKVNQESGEVQRPIDSSSHQNVQHRPFGVSTSQQHIRECSDASRRTARSNGAGSRSADYSPLHPHYQAKMDTKGSVISSPSRERKGSYEGTQGLAPSTPGRSRLRSVPRGSETPDRSASVPKFGEWDETDPASADGYSYIFNRVKEERHGNGGNASDTTSEAKRYNGQKHHRGNDAKSCCCFPWGGN